MSGDRRKYDCKKKGEEGCTLSALFFLVLLQHYNYFHFVCAIWPNSSSGFASVRSSFHNYSSAPNYKELSFKSGGTLHADSSRRLTMPFFFVPQPLIKPPRFRLKNILMACLFLPSQWTTDEVKINHNAFILQPTGKIYWRKDRRAKKP